ncbi:MAG: hypothetical protein LUC85_08885 [Bacteroidales bacterium]|nr:hypothetical protein [Bacteroidales bacterium]MCD8394928.1 hypothetical protein [Bacteroidales bacterium]
MNRGELLRLLRGRFTGAAGKDLLLFLVFLAVSAVFWLLLTLNDEVQRDFDIPVEITEIPDSITLISLPPQSISVSIKDKGSALLRYQWGKTPTLKMRFRDFHSRDNRILMGESQISAMLRGYFGQGAQIVSAKPDSINLVFTTEEGELVPVRLRLDAKANPRYVINGPITMSTDTVVIYSTSETHFEAPYIETVAVVQPDLKDTARVMARLKVPAGMRAIPPAVKVTIPVEPLISKTRLIPVEVINVPEGQSVVTFPSQAEVSFLVPMSSYTSDDFSLKAYADYSKASHGGVTSKLPLQLMSSSERFRDPILSIDSVEYVVEQQ